SPNIFGLTSSLLYDNISADELKQTISSMESIMHCKAQTATDLVAVDRHTISPPVENIILSSDDNKDQMNSQLIADVRQILKGALCWLHSCQVSSDVCRIAIQLLEKSLLVVNVLGPWSTVHAKSAARSNPNEELTSGSEMWQVIMLQYVQTKLRMVYTICNWYMGDHKSVDLAYVSPKVHRLLEVLKEYKPLSDGNDKQSSSQKYNDRNESNYVSWWQDSDAEDEEDFMEGSKKGDAQEENQPSLFINTLCGIVFIRDRYVAMMLQKLIRDLSKEDKELKHVSCSHLTPGGEGGKQDIDPASMDQGKQEEVLRKFRSHEINLLICTGELEDCAYMPKCNLVVRFDVPKSYRSYAESKSRARAQTSAYVMLVREAEKSEFMEKLQEYKKIEQVLLGQDWQNDADMYSSDDETGDTLCPPLMLTRNQCVTVANAVNIVNRYCNRLPSDPFTHLTPRCELMELPHDGDSPMYTCVLQLPINSHVREPIQGAPMPSVLLAQQAVAMETCKILYHSGELDENLMPIGKETVKYAEELDPWKREISSISGRPGSTKKRQTYNKDSPNILRSCLPQPESNLFMYEVRMRIRVPLLDELNVRRRRLFFPEDTTRCFGILTTKLLPQIPGFPIFTRSGEESCQLKFCRGFIQLSPQQVKLVRIFHRYVFSDMLRVDRVPLSFQPEQSSSQLLVVVLNKGKGTDTIGVHGHPTILPLFFKSPRAYSSKCDSLDIDWSFMMRTESKRRVIEKIKSDPWYKHRMTEMNKVFVFNRELYEDGVVVAKYRSLTFYKSFYVAELKDDMTPQSSFPSSEYQSFQHYYKVKYGLNIRCLKQPLLDVDHTSSRLNLLTPRHLNQKGKALPMSSLEKKRAKYESLHNRQILVPELCEVHPIPASLWRKAVCLPSVLYRVSQLLIAEELRQDIAVKSGITMETPPLGHIWSNLHFGWSDNSEEDLQENPNQLDDQSGKDKINEKNQLDNQSTSRDETDLKYRNKPDIHAVDNIDKNDTKHDCNGTVETEHPFSDAELTSQASSEDMSDEDVPLSSSDDDSFFSDDHEAHFELSDSEDSAAKREEVQKCERKKRPRKKSKELENVIEIPRTVLEEFVENYQTENLFIGPGPGLILQALTLSNASDGFNLERLEMLGDSFLKHAVTVYLYCTYPEAHEGKLSYMRSKKVSNYNLYRIGKQFGLAGKMTGLIFDPTVNWLPTGFVV
uniref:ribonuclease III n=1 Tax=Ciona savignyi TaxID=51511 RepID=H2YYK3_CIOSA